jgi:dienelactone hydrolase
MLNPYGDYNIFSFYHHKNQNTAIEVFKYIKMLNNNCLIIYGENDDTVIYEAQEAIDILKKMNPKLECTLIKNAGHSFTNSEASLGKIINKWIA